MQLYFLFFILLICHLSRIGKGSILDDLIGKHSILYQIGRNILLDFSEDSTNLTPAEIIVQAGYPSEIHNIITEDGYILTVNRIPGSNESIPVLLQHEFLGSAADWLIAGKGKSLAYILSDNGFDVWLGNSRGNTYSTKHIELLVSDPQFWNFSIDDLSYYDQAAMVSYISELRNDSLFYIGHSMGGQTFCAMAIERPEIAENVKAMFALAPAIYTNNMKSYIKYLSIFWEEIQLLLNKYGIYQFLSRNTLFDIFAKYACNTFAFSYTLCSTPLFMIAGFNPAKLDDSLLHDIWTKFPAGTSTNVFIQLLQQIEFDAFRKFDYGTLNNLKMYNNPDPPEYDLSKLKVPVAVFWSDNDWLLNKTDAKYFYDQVPYKLGFFEVNDDKFNHFDFLWAHDASELVYYPIVAMMSNFSSDMIQKPPTDFIDTLERFAYSFISYIF